MMEEDFITEQHRSDYQDRIKRTFVDDPLARFVQDFRNYVLHRSVPRISLVDQISIEKKMLKLDLTHMLAWQKWSPPARSYIESHKPDVRILEVVDQYEAMVRSSHEAFVLSFQTYYEKPINETLALMQQWNRGLQE
jgi:hypothetical protein